MGEPEQLALIALRLIARLGELSAVLAAAIDEDRDLTAAEHARIDAVILDARARLVAAGERQGGGGI